MRVVVSAGLLLCSWCSAVRGGILGSFDHGVASGDPRHDRIILWTRLTPRGSPASVTVSCTVGTTPNVSVTPVASRMFVTTADADWTVKWDATGLDPRRQYYFQFWAGTVSSPVGRFKLPPRPGQHLEEIKYAVFSCTNWGFGHFNAYRSVAQQQVDFWMHLGDWFYEYGEGHYPAADEAVRVGIQPPHELVSLEDYRQRHAFYRRDGAVQALSAVAPLIAAWDDHEFADDNWFGGANHHNESDQGDWFARKAASARAYREWMPVRGLDESHRYDLYRKFEFGDLATLLMLETRALARTTQLESPPAEGWVAQRVGALLEEHAAGLTPSQWGGTTFEAKMQELRQYVEAYRGNESKMILGPTQLSWVRQNTESSVQRGQPWQLYGQQQVMQDHYAGNWEAAIARARAQGQAALAGEWASALEAVVGKWPWLPAYDQAPPTSRSYSPAAEFADVLNHAVELDRRTVLGAVVYLAIARYRVADFFDDWSGYLAERERLLGAISSGGSRNGIVYGGDSHSAWAGPLAARDGTIVAAEFDGMSVTSPNSGSRIGFLPMSLVDAGVLASNPDMKWADLHSKGYMMATVSHQRHKVQYFDVSVTTDEAYDVTCLAAFEVQAGTQNRIESIPCESSQSGERCELRVSCDGDTSLQPQPCSPLQTPQAAEADATQAALLGVLLGAGLVACIVCVVWCYGRCCGTTVRRGKKRGRRRGYATAAGSDTDDGERVPVAPLGREVTEGETQI